jgi:serine acetyltransferase
MLQIRDIGSFIASIDELYSDNKVTDEDFAETLESYLNDSICILIDKILETGVNSGNQAAPDKTLVNFFNILPCNKDAVKTIKSKSIDKKDLIMYLEKLVEFVNKNNQLPKKIYKTLKFINCNIASADCFSNKGWSITNVNRHKNQSTKKPPKYPDMRVLTKYAYAPLAKKFETKPLEDLKGAIKEYLLYKNIQLSKHLDFLVKFNTIDISEFKNNIENYLTEFIKILLEQEKEVQAIGNEIISVVEKEIQSLINTAQLGTSFGIAPNEIGNLSHKVFDKVKSDIEAYKNRFGDYKLLLESNKIIFALCCYRLSNLLCSDELISSYYPNKPDSQNKKDFIESLVISLGKKCAIVTSLDIHPLAQIGNNFTIGPKDVKIARNCRIGNNCYIGEGATLGNNAQHEITIILKDNVKIHKNVNIQGHIELGCFCEIEPNIVLKRDSFDSIPENSRICIVNQLQVQIPTTHFDQNERFIVYGIVPEGRSALSIIVNRFSDDFNIDLLDEDGISSKYINIENIHKIGSSIQLSLSLNGKIPDKRKFIKKTKVKIRVNNLETIIMDSIGLRETLERMIEEA